MPTGILSFGRGAPPSYRPPSLEGGGYNVPGGGRRAKLPTPEAWVQPPTSVLTTAQPPTSVQPTASVLSTVSTVNLSSARSPTPEAAVQPSLAQDRAAEEGTCYAIKPLWLTLAM